MIWMREVTSKRTKTNEKASQQTNIKILGRTRRHKMRGNTKKNGNLAPQAEDRSGCEEGMFTPRRKVSSPTKWKEGNTKPTARIMRLRRASYYGVQPTAWYKSHEDPTVMMRKLLQQWGWWENHFYQRLWNTAYSWLQRSQWSSDKVQWRWWGRHRASNYKVQAPERYILQQDTMRRMGSHRASKCDVQLQLE